MVSVKTSLDENSLMAAHSFGPPARLLAPQDGMHGFLRCDKFNAFVSQGSQVSP